MRYLKLKDTPLRPTPEVKDTTNYSRPYTEDEKAVIIKERPKVKKSWKQMQKEMDATAL